MLGIRATAAAQINPYGARAARGSGGWMNQVARSVTRLAGTAQLGPERAEVLAELVLGCRAGVQHRGRERRPPTAATY